jgi:hypothetical protein
MRALQPDPNRRLPDMTALGQELSTWLDSAEAAGWGDEPLPGYSAQDRETATVAGFRHDGDPETRLAPYVDALATGPVGVRRSAAEGLVAAARMGDGVWLSDTLARAPEGARFALARALGKVGEPEAMTPLLALLDDPFAQREAAEAAAELALRTGQVEAARQALREAGLGATWRWPARATLGDEAWIRAVVTEWPGLTAPFRLQALEAARRLPEPLRVPLKAATADAAGQARVAWEQL